MATDRFARHEVLAGFRQPRVRDAKVLVVGLGGLGSPVALYLAAAGVGQLSLVDFGKVDDPDLQRQILYGLPDMGKSKATAAAARIHAAHPDVEVQTFDRPFEPAMVAGHDVVVDGTDEAGTRALVHAACIQTGVPLVWGALEAWEGQITTVLPGGPCLDCLFPDRGDAPACQDIGVFGPLAGTVGTLMAGEALKTVMEMEVLHGRLLVIDARRSSVDEVRFTHRRGCPCGATK